MKKIVILLLGLSLTAASCDLANGVFDFSASGPRGVLRSEDGGESFRTADKLVNRGDISGLSVNSLVFDSGNPDILYLGSLNGIYKSDDAAKTWHYILSGIGVADVEVDPYQSNIIYAAGITGSNGKIIKSSDGGTSWADIYTEPSRNNPVLAIAVSKNSSAQVLAGLSTGEIIRSLDGGQTWQASQDFADRIIRIEFGPSGSVYALTQKKGVWKSSDEGRSWSAISSFLSGVTLNSSIQTPTSVTLFFDLTLDRKQSGVLYLATQQGVFRTVNDGGSWSFLALPVKNASLQTSAVAVNPGNSNNLYAAVASTIFKSSNGGVTWETNILPTGIGVRSILINPQSNNLIYLGMGLASQ